MKHVSVDKLRKLFWKVVIMVHPSNWVYLKISVGAFIKGDRTVFIIWLR
jgi:hypothetical protein